MASKDKATGMWMAQWYEVDAYGKKKRCKKRGFKTAREAKKYEYEKSLKVEGSMNMLLKDFVDVYFEDKKNELKERTCENKRDMMNRHIIPYFGDLKINDITPAQITKWQNEMCTKGYSDSYLRMLQNQLTCLFTHATRIYDLQNNPCKKVKRMGKSDSRSMTFWTIEEYEKFIETFDKDDKYYLLFEILFWTGMREGELLALTKGDVDFSNNKIRINKTYYRANGEDVITTPKTEQSIRTIDIPNFLKNEIKEYCDRKYAFPDDERLFPVGAEAVQHKMKRMIGKAGVPKIRVHDIRHSHVSYLINQGVEPLIIKERLGHKDIKITMNTYGHLYPNQQKKVAEMLDIQRNKRLIK